MAKKKTVDTSTAALGQQEEIQESGDQLGTVKAQVEKKLTKEAAAKAAETTKAADEKQSSQSSSSNEKQGSSSSKKSSGNNFNTYSNDYSDVSKNYVLNTNTKKFHYPSCRSVEKIAPKTLQPVKQGMKQFPKGMTLAEYAIHNP